MMNISAAEFNQIRFNNQNFCLIDVREPIEYHTFNIGGINIPLGKLNDNFEALKLNKTQTIVVLCQHGIRSITALEILKTLGYNQVKNLLGGLVALRKFNQQ